MQLRYLPANQAFAFTFGDALCRMGDDPMFYQTRPEAVAAAARHGLTVWAYGQHASFPAHEVVTVTV